MQSQWGQKRTWYQGHDSRKVLKKRIIVMNFFVLKFQFKTKTFLNFVLKLKHKNNNVPKKKLKNKNILREYFFLKNFS